MFKKFLAVILGMLLIMSIATGCATKNVVPEVHKNETIVYIIDDGMVTVIAINNFKFKDNAFLYEAMISADYEDSFKGEYDTTTPNMPMITKIGTLSPNADNKEFISIYTDVAALIDMEYGTSTTCYGLTYSTTKVGVGQLPLIEGGRYLIKIATWG